MKEEKDRGKRRKGKRKATGHNRGKIEKRKSGKEKHNGQKKTFFFFFKEAPLSFADAQHVTGGLAQSSALISQLGLVRAANCHAFNERDSLSLPRSTHRGSPATFSVLAASNVNSVIPKRRKSSTRDH